MAKGKSHNVQQRVYIHTFSYGFVSSQGELRPRTPSRPPAPLPLIERGENRAQCRRAQAGGELARMRWRRHADAVGMYVQKYTWRLVAKEVFRAGGEGGVGVNRGQANKAKWRIDGHI